jgi:hypothetical protein
LNRAKGVRNVPTFIRSATNGLQSATTEKTSYAGRYGATIFNDLTGGVGEREMAEEGLNFFTELKTVFINYSGKAERLMIR